MRGVDGVVVQKPAEVPALKPKEVRVKITHTGVCGTDLFYIQSGCALGHEGVGIVEEIGSAVTLHKVGDRVGGGYLRAVRHSPHPRGWLLGGYLITDKNDHRAVAIAHTALRVGTSYAIRAIAMACRVTPMAPLGRTISVLSPTCIPSQIRYHPNSLHPYSVLEQPYMQL